MRILIPALSLLGLMACGDGDLEGDPAVGASVFATSCALCHGDDGTGTDNGPDITDRITELTKTEISEIIGGARPSMPAVPLSDQEEADVTAYLDDQWGPTQAE